MSLTLRRLSKSYDADRNALGPLDLDIADGELVAVLGRSGAGKTTMLRLIAGLEKPDDGSVSIDGESVDSLPPARRGVSLVFQESALYPHLSARENLVFGMRLRRDSTAAIDSRVAEVAEKLQLTALLERRPAQLSGGERQRVALGRALMRRPQVLLLDEPFAQLDAPLRAELRAELRSVHERSGATTVLVTHDARDAFALADRIAVLDRGRLVIFGTASELESASGEDSVAELIADARRHETPTAIRARGESHLSPSLSPPTEERPTRPTPDAASS